MSKFQFRVEMRVGQGMREVDADAFSETGAWFIFYREPPRGGREEYWRVRSEDVVSMEVKRT